MKGSVHWLHGFLGQARDGDVLFQGLTPDFVVHQADLFSPHTSLSQYGDPLTSLRAAGQWVNAQARDLVGPQFLVGYSWGGRVALHAVLESPHLWAGAVILGGHPGLRDAREKEERLESDRLWAQRFLHEDWETVLRSWNEQPIFRQPQSVGELRVDPPRWEADYSRKKLAQVLVGCSLGVQQDLRPRLSELTVPILWISGECDVKFSAIQEEMLSLNPRFQGRSVAGVGHRVLNSSLSDGVDGLRAILDDFLRSKS
jgi:2-succinyl-6-hydroxy-2,4-cyclohexadiene-1-carboxylate synthase